MASRVALLRRLAGSYWGAAATTLRITTLALVHTTAEYCAPVWCRNVHTRLLGPAINDALRIVTGCLHHQWNAVSPMECGVGGEPWSELTASAPVSGVSAPACTNGVWPPLRPVSVAQKNKPSTMSSTVQCIDLPMDCMAWRFWKMRQPNGCSTSAPRSTVMRPSSGFNNWLIRRTTPSVISINEKWPKQHYYVRSRKKSSIMSEFQLNLQKHVNICCCSLYKVKTNCATRTFDLTTNFYLMINFDFFDLITLVSLIVWAWNLVYARFMSFEKGRIFLTSVIFGCVSHYICWSRKRKGFGSVPNIACAEVNVCYSGNCIESPLLINDSKAPTMYSVWKHGILILSKTVNETFACRLQINTKQCVNTNSSLNSASAICPIGQVSCGKNSSLCLNRSQICDGHSSCPLNADERYEAVTFSMCVEPVCFGLYCFPRTSLCGERLVA